MMGLMESREAPPAVLHKGSVESLRTPIGSINETVWKEDEEREKLKKDMINVTKKKEVRSTTTPYYCLLCLDEAPDMLDHKSFCRVGNTSDGCSTCLSCLKGYVASLTSSALKGTIPSLYCPVCPPPKEKGESNRCLLDYSFLLKLSESNVDLKCQLDNYADLARSVGSIQCGTCHCRTSIHVSPSAHDIEISRQALACHNNMQYIEKYVQCYDCGEMGVESFFAKVATEIFANLSTLTDIEAWNSKILNLLRLISNPERRINFQLRYLRNRPQVWTQCHNRAQCFKCKTKSFHTGKTCAQVCNTYDNEVLSCPQCGVFLVKGDGCDSVQCVCGKYFSYSTLATHQRHVRKFELLFPTDTAWICARILCVSDNYCNPESSICTAENMKLASAWSKAFPVDIDKSLLSWWCKKHPKYTVQCSIDTLPNGIPEGIVRARELFRKCHAAAIEHEENQRHIARMSILDTFYPLSFDKERLLQRKVVDQASDSQIAKEESFLLYGRVKEAHVRDYISSPLLNSSHDARIMKTLETRSQQFLSIFGHLPLRLFDHPNHGLQVSRPVSTNGNVKSLAIGDHVDVSPLSATSTNLENRRGIIINQYRSGNLVFFDIELKTQVKIVLKRISVDRINSRGQYKSVYVVPTLAMSSNQIEMFLSFVKYIEKYITFHQIQAAHLHDMQSFLKEIAIPDIRLGEHDVNQSVQKSVDKDFAPDIAAKYSWKQLYDRLKCCQLDTKIDSQI